MNDIAHLMDAADADIDLMIVNEMLDVLIAWLRSLQKYEPDLHEPQDGKKPIAQMVPALNGRYIQMSTALRALPDLIEKLQQEE